MDVRLNDALRSEVAGPGDEGFEALFRSSPLGIIISSDEGRFVDVNDAAMRLLGLRREEMVGRTSDELRLYSSETRAQMFERVRNDGFVHAAELCLTASSGDQRDVLVSIERVGLGGRSRYVTTFLDITERKRAERNAAMNASRFRQLVERMHEGLAITDANSKFIFANDALARMLGYEPDELIGANSRALVPDVGDQAADNVRKQPLDGHGGPEESILRHKDGHLVPVAFDSVPFVDESGTNAGTLVIVTDLTERKRAEEDLRKKVRSFKAILEAAPDAVVAVEPNGRIVHVNSQTERLFGHARADLLGKPVEILIPERFRRRHQGHRTNFAADARTRPMASGQELFALRKDGTEFSVEISLSPVETEEGALVLTAIRDITDRKRAESKLREQHALYESMLGALSEVGEGVVINDGPRYVWANEAFARMLGYSVAEILALPSHLVLIPADHRGAQAEKLRARLAGELPDHGEVTMQHKSGRLVQVEYGTRPLRADDPSRRVTVVRDVTERKQMQTRMIIGDRMASVGTLAAGVAHEINNPLAYVMANLDMIAEEFRSAEGPSSAARVRDLVTMVNEARQGAERVRKIVRGLHTFSRADEERRTLLDVRSVLELSINMAFNEIKHRARLVKDYGEVVPVEADETRLGQVFINLLVNAAQAIPEGCADRNEIRLVTRMDSPSRVIVEVRDTGGGIPASVIDRIFEPFFTTKDIGQGTGLGLSICHGIVTGLGGEITVESVEGRGSAFRVALPPAGPRWTSHHREPPTAPHPAPTKAGHVLVIDDDPMIGTTLARVLGKEHEVTVFTNGKQALEVLLAGRRFDVILCDLMMPVMTGMDLHAELMRAIPETAERMVFITGGAFTPSARAFLDAIPNQRLEKPFAPQNLRAIVRSLIR